MYLYNDLYTIYGDLLVKKEREITPDVIKSIRAMGSHHRQIRVPLKGSFIFKDFQSIFDDYRYITMFEKPVSRKDISNVAGKLKLENDLMFELSTMKKNLPYTYYHVLVVAAFAIKLSLLFDNRHYNKEIVSHCGFTHDIGKTRIPISVLEKSAKLTTTERALIETHPTAGYLLLNYYLKRDRVVCSLAGLDHHEKLDGSGYPRGIRRVNKYTQLISPVDIMDALMTRRPYRRKVFSLRATLDYLLKESDAKRLNKRVVLTLISLARKTKPDVGAMKISRIPREPLPERITHDKYR